MNNTKYAFFRGQFKGSFAKGADALRTVVQDSELSRQISDSREAMTVIFEPMETGDPELLRSIFMQTSRFNLGRGLQTYYRIADPGFDGDGLLDNVQNLADLIAVIPFEDEAFAPVLVHIPEWVNETLIQTFPAEDRADIIASDVWMRNIGDSTLAVRAIRQSANWYNAMAASPNVGEFLNNKKSYDLWLNNAASNAFINSANAYPIFCTSPLAIWALARATMQPPIAGAPSISWEPTSNSTHNNAANLAIMERTLLDNPSLFQRLEANRSFQPSGTTVFYMGWSHDGDSTSASSRDPVIWICRTVYRNPDSATSGTAYFGPAWSYSILNLGNLATYPTPEYVPVNKALFGSRGGQRMRAYFGPSYRAPSTTTYSGDAFLAI